MLGLVILRLLPSLLFPFLFWFLYVFLGGAFVFCLLRCFPLLCVVCLVCSPFWRLLSLPSPPWPTVMSWRGSAGFLLVSSLGYLVALVTARASGWLGRVSRCLHWSPCTAPFLSGVLVRQVPRLHGASWQQRPRPCVGLRPLHHAACVVLVPGVSVLSRSASNVWPRVTITVCR